MMNTLNECSVDELPKFIKNARNKAIVGDYIKSLEIYKIAIRTIQKRYESEIHDNFIVQKWKKLEEDLKAECATILQAYDLCKVFQQDQIDFQRKAEWQNEHNNQVLMRNYKAPKPHNNVPDEVRWAHFGGQPPFAYHQNSKSPGKLGGGNLGQNLFYNDLNFDEFRPKDPDVWDPPDDLPRQPARRKTDFAKKPDNKPPEYLFANNDELEKKRNYDKPWKVPQVVGAGGAKKAKPNAPPSNSKKTGNSKNAAPEPPSNKSEFLLARYPEDKGEGPDTALVNMIEMEVLQKNPNVSLADIAGLETAKKALQEAVILPLVMPTYFTGLRRPWKGVLLYGPPGTGKTLLAKALATQGKTTFFNVSATTFASKWRGESEKLVRILFEMARFYGPSTIFIDEIDSVGGKRTEGENEASRRVMSEMLVQMDGVSSQVTLEKPKDDNAKKDDKKPEENKPKNVMVLGATNHPWDLDDALRRRFEKRIYIPLPDERGREKMFEINLKGINLEKDINYKELVKLTDGYSGADIANVCREAALMQMRRKLSSSSGDYDLMALDNLEEFRKELENAPVTMKDIKAAIKNISKSVSKNDLKRYEDWTKEFSNQ